jgi:hypothetical protein
MWPFASAVYGGLQSALPGPEAAAEGLLALAAVTPGARLSLAVGVAVGETLVAVVSATGRSSTFGVGAALIRDESTGFAKPSPGALA